MNSIEEIKKMGHRAKGRAERTKFLEGKHLTRNEAIWAQCYDCQGGYIDGISDCKNHSCSLYGYHPYKGIK